MFLNATDFPISYVIDYPGIGGTEVFTFAKNPRQSSPSKIHIMWYFYGEV